MDQQFKLTKEFIEDIQDYVSASNGEAVIHALSDIHEADIAEILDVVDMEEAKFIFQLLEDERASDVLVELEEEVKHLKSRSRELHNKLTDWLSTLSRAELIEIRKESEK